VPAPEETEFVKAETLGLNFLYQCFLPQYSCKKHRHAHFYWNKMSFCIFLACFLGFSYLWLSFNCSLFCQPRLTSFILHLLKIKTLFKGSVVPDEKKCVFLIRTWQPVHTITIMAHTISKRQRAIEIVCSVCIYQEVACGERINENRAESWPHVVLNLNQEYFGFELQKPT
jgi:hypothetical protein